MFSIQTQRRLLILVATLTLLAGATGIATAQEVPNEDDANATATPGATEVVEQLGDLQVHSYSWDGEVMTISATWEGQAPTTVTMTEMIELDSEGSTEISFKRVRLAPEERTELRIPVEGRSNGVAAVLLSTPESVEEGNALVLQDGAPGSSDPVPFDWAMMLVGAAALGGAGMAFIYTRKKRDEGDPERRERIA